MQNGITTLDDGEPTMANGVVNLASPSGVSPAVSLPASGTDRQDNSGRIKEGKEKAKAVMAASGVSVDNASSEVAQKPESVRNTSPANRLVNGTPQSRKRSRSGSRLTPQRISKDPEQEQLRARHDEYLLKLYSSRELIHSDAIRTQAVRSMDIGQKQQEMRDYYDGEVRHLRHVNPGAVFGRGYAGFGNGHTDDKPRLLYPMQRKRVGNRRARELKISRKDLAMQAEQLNELIPIRLEIDYGQIRLRDTFTWNLHDRVVSTELFAETIVEDLRVPPEAVAPLTQLVNREIQDQIRDFYPHVFIEEEALDPHLPYHAYKNDEMRILIKLNITIGQHTLVDQFDWDLNDRLNSPEEFARQMARDLSLSGEFVTAIAHSIREQTQMFTKSLYISGHPFDGRPIEDADVRDNFLPTPISSVFRPAQSAKDYSPYLYELNVAELERTEYSIMRDQRRQKRSVNRRGGPALPDLKDRLRTVRTLVVSSILPGAAESIEESRLFKATRTSGRGKRNVQPADGADDFEESESEVSADDFTAATTFAGNTGTARTRNARGAATAAQVAMRATTGRSETPEMSSGYHAETRRMPRRSDYDHISREESVAEPTSLIVKLSISSERFRQWLEDRKGGRGGEYSTPKQPATPLMSSQNLTPRAESRGSVAMPPPSTPGTVTHAQQTPQRRRSRSGSDDGELDWMRYHRNPHYLPDGRVEGSSNPAFVPVSTRVTLKRCDEGVELDDDADMLSNSLLRLHGLCRASRIFERSIRTIHLKAS